MSPMKSANQKMPPSRFTPEHVTIERHRPEYREHFKALNIEWLERYFHVEPHDVELLSDPEREIIDRGGEIFFAVHDGEVIGTCALLKLDVITFELAKMAVTEAAQGLGIGMELALAVIAEAKRKGAATIVLDTNTKLTSAMGLYRKLGFVEKRRPVPSVYERTNIYLQLDLR